MTVSDELDSKNPLHTISWLQQIVYSLSLYAVQVLAFQNSILDCSAKTLHPRSLTDYRVSVPSNNSKSTVFLYIPAFFADLTSHVTDMSDFGSTHVGLFGTSVKFTARYPKHHPVVIVQLHLLQVRG